MGIIVKGTGPTGGRARVSHLRRFSKKLDVAQTATFNDKAWWHQRNEEPQQLEAYISETGMSFLVFTDR